MNALTPIAGPGHNNPPVLTPYEAHRAHIDDLYTEARNWCDGSGIQTQAQADEVSRLLGMIREAEKAADAARKEEAKPHDDAKTEIQTRYNVLIGNTVALRGKTILAAEACKATLAPWLKRVEQEQLQAAAEARRVADEAAAAAQAAIKAAAPDDLEARESAEDLVNAARYADRQANRAGNAKASGAGLNRAVTLRSVWKADITDMQAAAKHFWATDPEAFRSTIQHLADLAVRSGKRQLPGIAVTEDRVPV